ncbi:dockerin type I domain-containing protein [Aeoliella mucimassa]|uniref:Sialidase n=1 Tax=Aeoliella mucimassa TaxID=2527972 RepID=A0A518AMX0_9BACT|nr:dockerin type I domain-containing protein [Aeoliella mucimassa]QDU56068.1 Sialidase precursor [Aeoliella mucimassa]
MKVGNGRWQPTICLAIPSLTGLAASLILLALSLPAQAEILGLYSAGDGSVAFSPSRDWGWIPSWNEIAYPALGQSVTGDAGGGRTAWQITDQGNNGLDPNYSLTLFEGSPNLANARERGWSFSTTAQFVDTMSGSANQGLSAYFDDQLYQVMIDLDTAGQLRGNVYLSPIETATFVLASAEQRNEYHDYELRYDSANQQASFYFDDHRITSWPGYADQHETIFRFGSVTASGAGQMNYREVNMSIIPTPAEQGDFNSDGTVDLADYTVWRDTLGSRTLTNADGNGNGRVDSGDYVIWRNNYGRLLDGNSIEASNIAAVPELRSLSLLLVGATLLFASRPKR